MKRIFVTGANRGLGLALVSTLLARGNRVVGGCRNPAMAIDLQLLVQQYPSLLTLCTIDVSDEQSIMSAKKSVESSDYRLDLVINNAAVLYGDSILTMDTQKMIDSFKVNTIGPILVVRHFLDLLIKGENPAVITISSEAGSLARYKKSTTISSYAQTKSALNMALRLLSLELQKNNIPVVAVHPGWVKTDMGGTNADLTSQESAEGIVENIVEKVSMKMSGEFFMWNGESCPW